jgi:hypothetical protein
MDRSLKILLATAIALFAIGMTFIIVSTATLVKDNGLNCLFTTGDCVGYFLEQDSTFCCPLIGNTCYAKFYCNGDYFIVNGLRYMGIGSAAIGIILIIIVCIRKRKNPTSYRLQN